MLIALALAATAQLWQPLAPDVSYAPTTLTAPSPGIRRVLLKIDDVVTLYEYDCSRKTAAMLYVMRPGREPYAPGENVRTPHSYRPDSVHGVLTASVCARGMI